MFNAKKALKLTNETRQNIELIQTYDQIIKEIKIAAHKGKRTTIIVPLYDDIIKLKENGFLLNICPRDTCQIYYDISW